MENIEKRSVEKKEKSTEVYRGKDSRGSNENKIRNAIVK